MKKIFTAAALLLALTLCLTAAFAAGGDAGDPLISLSYLQNIFTSSADTQISQKLDQADTGVREEMDQQISGMKADILAASGLNKMCIRDSRLATSGYRTLVTELITSIFSTVIMMASRTYW